MQALFCWKVTKHKITNQNGRGAVLQDRNLFIFIFLQLKIAGKTSTQLLGERVWIWRQNSTFVNFCDNAINEFYIAF